MVGEVSVDENDRIELPASGTREVAYEIRIRALRNQVCEGQGIDDESVIGKDRYRV